MWLQHKRQSLVTKLYVSNVFRPKCKHAILAQGRAGWETCSFEFGRAMGDRRPTGPPGIQWDLYGTSELLTTVAAILAVIAGRVGQVGGAPTEAIAQAPVAPGTAAGANSSETEQETDNQTGGAQSSANTDLCWTYQGQGYLKDPNCGFRCRFCASACSRAPGHKLHSCYKCRKK